MPPPEAVPPNDDAADDSSLPAGNESPFAASGLQHEAGAGVDMAPGADVAVTEPALQPQASTPAPADHAATERTSGASAAAPSADITSDGGESQAGTSGQTSGQTPGQTPGQNNGGDKLNSTASASGVSDMHAHQDEPQGHLSGQGGNQFSAQASSQTFASVKEQTGDRHSGQMAGIGQTAGSSQTAGSGSAVIGEPASATSDKTESRSGGLSVPAGGAADAPRDGYQTCSQRNQVSGDTQTSAPGTQTGLDAEHGAPLEASTDDVSRTKDPAPDNMTGDGKPGPGTNSGLAINEGASAAGAAGMPADSPSLPAGSSPEGWTTQVTNEQV